MEQDSAAEANRLYWDTDETVNSIANRLELSRRALYDAIQPVPAGRDCPVCGGDLVYENRSARTADEAVCPQCPEDLELAPPPEPATPAEEDFDDVMRVGAAAVAGAAVGSLLTLLLVRRR